MFAWIASDEERRARKQVQEGELLFSDRYRSARELQAEAMADEILSIADDGRNDTYTDSEGNERVDYDHIARSKLRVDARKWVAAKLLPKKYGDKPAEVKNNLQVHNHLHISQDMLTKLQDRRAQLLERAGA